MFLLNIIENIYLNNIFYKAFRFFFKSKKKILYNFYHFCTLYKQLDLKDSKAIIINWNAILIAIIYKIFLYITNLLYL